MGDTRPKTELSGPWTEAEGLEDGGGVKRIYSHGNAGGWQSHQAHTVLIVG